MKRKEITRSFNKTVQVKQYEPEKVGVTQTVVLDEDDDPTEIAEQLHRENVDLVSREITSRLAAKRMEDADAEADD